MNKQSFEKNILPKSPRYNFFPSVRRLRHSENFLEAAILTGNLTSFVVFTVNDVNHWLNSNRGRTGNWSFSGSEPVQTFVGNIDFFEHWKCFWQTDIRHNLQHRRHIAASVLSVQNKFLSFLSKVIKLKICWKNLSGQNSKNPNWDS